MRIRCPTFRFEFGYVPDSVTVTSAPSPSIVEIDWLSRIRMNSSEGPGVVVADVDLVEDIEVERVVDADEDRVVDFDVDFVVDFVVESDVDLVEEAEEDLDVERDVDFVVDLVVDFEVDADVVGPAHGLMI